MKIYFQCISVWFLLLLCGAFVGVSEVRASESNVKDGGVLVISSYSPLKEKGVRIIETFVNTLEKKEPVRISVEYLDSESSTHFEDWTNWMMQLSMAYKVQPSVIVILGPEAWAAYRAANIEEWRDIPIVLGYIKDKFVDFEQLAKGTVATFENQIETNHTLSGFKVTGYYYDNYIPENVRFIKKLQPNVKRVAFCYDNRYSLDFFHDYLINLFSTIDDFDLCFLDGGELSTAQLLDTLSTFDDSYAVMLAGWYTDANKYPHAYTMLNNELRRYTSKPVYQFLDQDFMNMNYLGGYFVSGRELGQDLAYLTYDVLTKGIEKVPSFRQSPSQPRYHINYPTFMQSGIDRKLLPKEVSFYNVTPSLWEERPLEVILTVLLIFLMLVLFGVVLRYRRKKEEGYRASNERMMRLLGMLPDMVVIYNSNLRIIDVINPLKNVLLGFKRDDLIGSDMEGLRKMSPGSHLAFKQIALNVSHTFQTKEVRVFDYEVVRNGISYYGKARTVPFNGDQVICFVHDITVHVKAENEILKLKTFLQSVVDNIPVGLFVKDVSDEYRYLFYNDKVGDFYNDNSNILIGKNDYEVNDPFADKYRAEDEMVICSERPIQFDRVFTEKETGHPYRWAVTTKSRLINNDGSCYIISVMVETTEMRKKELELENIRKELSIALNAGKIIPWEYNVTTQTFSSPKTLEFEHGRISLYKYILCVYTDDKCVLQEGLENMVKGKTELLNIQIRASFFGDDMRWFEYHGQVVERDDNDNVVRIIGVRRDITNLKMTDELIELRNKAEESNRLKSAFLANMSHEIRTPLNAIVGFSNLIAQTEDRSEIDEFCRIIETNNELLLQLINDILDLSKIEAGQIEFHYSEVDIRTVFYNLEQVYKSKTKNGVVLQCVLPNDMHFLYTDKHRLTQVLSNFLGNACKFTTEGSIRMVCDYMEDKVRFSVADTGIGILPENIPDVFKRFAKFDSFAQGTGLGLSISESIIQSLGGEIGVESTQGKGSFFWFTLPNR